MTFSCSNHPLASPLFSRGFSRFAVWSVLVMSVAMATGCPPTPVEDDAGTSTNSDAGSVEGDAGNDISDAGNDISDAGSGNTDAGAGSDAGSAVVDAGTSASDAGTSSDAGISPRRDQCADDNDCTNGDLCLAFPASDDDATKVCVSQGAPPRIRCVANGDPGEGECCLDEDCAAGDHGAVCVAFEVGYCGGPAPPDYNTCRAHECTVDGDCDANSACILAGAFGLAKNICVPAFCGNDAKRTTGVGGQCRSYAGECSSAIGGFMCTYDDSACRTSLDCPQSGNGAFECLADQNGVPECAEIFARP
ncbi:MAG: hypothetical protein GY822_22020 [Deltaproteobacteria bacterium]|nr:hypothetical protein [Deltaproteobacteria bacterium]